VTYSFTVTPTNEVGDGFTATSTARPLDTPSIASLDAIKNVLPVSASPLAVDVPVPVSIGGFAANEWVAVIVRSTPQVIGSFQADNNGFVSTSVYLPSTLPNGKHTLSLYGTSSGNGASAPIQVGQIPTVTPTGLTTLTPSRIMNTRATGKIGSLKGTETATTFNVLGKGGLPNSGISAVLLNVTVVDPEVGNEGGYVTVYPCASGRPDASNLNFTNGQVIPNTVIAPVDPNGNICFYSYGKTHILADVAGYFSK
jgi:hypothetical protein